MFQKILDPTPGMLKLLYGMQALMALGCAIGTALVIRTALRIL